MIEILKNREDLAVYFSKLGFKTGAEIGVLEGVYSEVLCAVNPGFRLYCIDSWGINERRHHIYHLKAYEKAKIRLSPYKTTLIRKKSMDAVKDFSNESLGFVYIDADHRIRFVRDDIIEWSKRVRKGGIVSGHDYHGNIKIVVDDYINNNNLNLQVTTEKSDNALSWWFIKQQ